MKASIIITTFNRPELLQKAIESAKAQTYKDFEIIIVDDAVEKRGLAYCRNKGVELAKGQYIVWLDDDDTLHKDFLKETVPLLDSLSIEFGAIRVGRTINYPEGQIYQKAEIPYFYCSMDDGFLIRKSTFDKVKVDETLLTDEDADYGLQFLKHFKIWALDIPLLYKEGHSAIGKGSYYGISKTRVEGLNKFLDKNIEYIYENKKEFIHICGWAGRTFILNGEKEKGLRFLREALVRSKTFGNLTGYIAALFNVYKPYYILETKYMRYKKIYVG